MKHERVLFILKLRSNYGSDIYNSSYSYGHYFSSGLYWSAKFVVDMLLKSGVEAKLVQVVDNNDIDREVHLFKPTQVVIEALWVVPEKFDVLKKLYPKITWVVRIHSNIPFLSNEGIAIKWIKEYVRRGVKVAVNEIRCFQDLRVVLESGGEAVRNLLYLPNYYPVKPATVKRQHRDGKVHIGCFGAVRPMKNQLIQAIAAIRYADDYSKILYFYINGSRIEMGDSALENIQSLFKGTKHHLVQCGWMSHGDFLKYLEHLDLGMQVSLSETFSIVAADIVNVGVPVLVSDEVGWASSFSKVNSVNGEEITAGIKKALTYKRINVKLNRNRLKHFSRQSKNIWLEYLGEK
jgi:hypothetical protein